MSLLLLVRHGDAVWDDEGYGGLSEKGAAQARALGAFWAEQGIRVDRVFAGPRVRHQETADAVAEVIRGRGGAWPETETLLGLDEYDAERVLLEGAPQVLDDDVPELQELGPKGLDSPEGRRLFARAFQQVTRAWAERRFACSEAEAFEDFRRRVGEVLAEISRRAGRGASVAAFTSGGPVAAAVGEVLRAGDVPVIELSWVIRNTSVTEVLFSGDRFGVRAVNVDAHLLKDRKGER